MSNNRLRSVPSLWNSTKLEVLILSRNEIAESPTWHELASCENLRELYIFYNRLTSLAPLVNLTRLLHFGLRGNMLVDLNVGVFDGLPNLITLDLSENQINNVSDFVFAKLTSLRALNLASNNLLQIRSAWFPSRTIMESVFFDGNQIVKIDYKNFASLGQLVSMSMNRNRIVDISAQAFDGLSRLHTLSLSHNHIRAVHRYQFKGLGRLKNLHLDHNLLSSYLPNDAFRELRMLTTLDLRRNSISAIYRYTFYNAKSVETLDLSHNRISYFSTKCLRHQSALKRLYLQENRLYRLSVLSFTQQTSLETLDVSSNRFRALPFEWLRPLTSLSRLRVANNPLACDRCEAVLWLNASAVIVDLAETQCDEPLRERGRRVACYVAEHCGSPSGGVSPLCTRHVDTTAGVTAERTTAPEDTSARTAVTSGETPASCVNERCVSTTTPTNDTDGDSTRPADENSTSTPAPRRQTWPDVDDTTTDERATSERTNQQATTDVVTTTDGGSRSAVVRTTSDDTGQQTSSLSTQSADHSAVMENTSTVASSVGNSVDETAMAADVTSGHPEPTDVNSDTSAVPAPVTTGGTVSDNDNQPGLSRTGHHKGSMSTEKLFTATMTDGGQAKQTMTSTDVTSNDDERTGGVESGQTDDAILSTPAYTDSTVGDDTSQQQDASSHYEAATPITNINNASTGTFFDDDITVHTWTSTDVSKHGESTSDMSTNSAHTDASTLLSSAFADSSVGDSTGEQQSSVSTSYSDGRLPHSTDIAVTATTASVSDIAGKTVTQTSGPSSDGRSDDVSSQTSVTSTVPTGAHTDISLTSTFTTQSSEQNDSTASANRETTASISMGDITRQTASYTTDVLTSEQTTASSIKLGRSTTASSSSRLDDVTNQRPTSEYTSEPSRSTTGISESSSTDDSSVTDENTSQITAAERSELDTTYDGADHSVPVSYSSRSVRTDVSTVSSKRYGGVSTVDKVVAENVTDVTAPENAPLTTSESVTRRDEDTSVAVTKTLPTAGNERTEDADATTDDVSVDPEPAGMETRHGGSASTTTGRQGGEYITDSTGPTASTTRRKAYGDNGVTSASQSSTSARNGGAHVSSTHRAIVATTSRSEIDLQRKETPTGLVQTTDSTRGVVTNDTAANVMKPGPDMGREKTTTADVSEQTTESTPDVDHLPASRRAGVVGDNHARQRAGRVTADEGGSHSAPTTVTTRGGDSHATHQDDHTAQRGDMTNSARSGRSVG